MALRFEELIERHHDEIFAYVWRLLGVARRADGAVDAEDLVQDVFLRAYENFLALRPGSNHRAWLYKIATNRTFTALTRAKHRRKKAYALRQELAPTALAPDHEHGGQHVVHCLEALPVKQKASITLRYLQDLDYPEIARILDCSEESARANVSQAIRRLRVLLKEER
ncbi:MAG TPA: RNA polymerase sigma factor [Terriglobales bacterium]|nr:RNA polymerase sigma factor [Terriglobales bacterium]